MPQNLTNTRQYGRTFRVEFTLTKLAFGTRELKTNYSCSQKEKKKKKLTKATETEDL